MQAEIEDYEASYTAGSTCAPETAPRPSTLTPGRSLSPQLLKRRLVLADALSIALAFAATFGFQALVRPVDSSTQHQHLLLGSVGLPIWLVAIGANKLYRARVIERPSHEFRKIVSASLVAASSMVMVAFALKFAELSRLWVVTVTTTGIALVTVERAIARKVFTRLRRERRISRRILIVGTDTHAVELLYTLQHNPELGYEVVGFVGDEDFGQRDGVMVLGPLADTEEILAETEASGVMVSLPSVPAPLVNHLTRRLTDAGYHVALSSSMRDIDSSRFRPQSLDGRTLLYIEPTIRGGWRAHAKRAFDLAVASFLLVVSAPVLAICALAIKLDSPGPVLFRQERIGRDGARFRIIKLRTMVTDAEQRKQELAAHNEMDGPLFKMARDPRITRVGRILRKLSIDELPQFWNVIKGEMSVVGPRPALPDEVAQWPLDLHSRLRVLPGITGMWQVSGRSETTFEEYKRLDLYYVDNWSLLHDLRIVLKTGLVVLFQRGAH
jgi:exopolysaccharide biosynthesis polyprenyl glycosylphosphotransferase